MNTQHLFKRKETKPLKAILTLGLKQGYTESVFSLEDVTAALSSVQRELQNKQKLYLSAKVTPCNIVFSGQNEPSVSIGFINYPKFPVSETAFKSGVEFIATKLMDNLDQNRVVIEFPDKTVMLEMSAEIDPDIEL